MVEEKNLKILKKQLDSGDIFNYLPQERIERILEKKSPKSDTQIILELAKKHPEGISIADCIIATNKTSSEMKVLLEDVRTNHQKHRCFQYVFLCPPQFC